MIQIHRIAKHLLHKSRVVGLSRKMYIVLYQKVNRTYYPLCQFIINSIVFHSTNFYFPFHKYVHAYILGPAHIHANSRGCDGGRRNCIHPKVCFMLVFLKTNLEYVLIVLIVKHFQSLT